MEQRGAAGAGTTGYFYKWLFSFKDGAILREREMLEKIGFDILKAKKISFQIDYIRLSLTLRLWGAINAWKGRIFTFLLIFTTFYV